MNITHGHQPGSASEQRTATFVGTVWADPVLAVEGAPVVNTVMFTPGGRTNWHSHEHGQLLFVTHGNGFAQVRDGEGAELMPGDVVWFPPGEIHWHGARPGTFMSHVAISLGTTSWLAPVTDDEFRVAAPG